MEKKKLNPAMAGGLLAAAVTLILASLLALAVYRNTREQHLTLAAGSHTGESYILCAALKSVVERHNPIIHINLIETGGTVENLRMIDDGRAALAVAQADVLAGPTARILAILFDDTFQLLAFRDSPIDSFAGLKGKTIALARTGGQFQSFLRVAAHFGLDEADFHFTGETDNAADKAFAEHRADALFRVRALGNPDIQRLIRTSKIHLVRIDHASAMKISYPAFQPSTIPAGAYMGNPAVPAEDLPSISVHRTFLASASVDDETIRAVTGALIDNRQEIAREIPEQAAAVRLLLAQVRRPEMQAQLGPALHPGAVKFYEKDKPSFILSHADYLGLLLTVLVMISSWIWELRAWFQNQQKTMADQYSNQVVALMNTAREAKSHAELQSIRAELLDILTIAVADLDKDKLSEDSFDSFRSILQICLDVVRDNAVALDMRAAEMA